MRFHLPWWVPPVTAALLLRLSGAVALRPWHDEYFTTWAAQLPLRELLDALRWDSGPPGPYLLTKLVSSLGLPPLWASRALSVGAGVGATALVGSAARRLFSPGAGTVAAWLYAVHPLAVMWGSEGRAYGLLSLAVATGLWSLAHLKNGKGCWLPLAAALSFALYTHALGLVWLVATLAYGLVRRANEVLRAAGVAALSFLPWLPVMWHQPSEAVAWMATAFRELPPWAWWLGALRLLPPVSGWGYTLEAPQPAWLLQGAAAAVTLVALSRVRGWVWLLPAFPAAALSLGWWLGLPVYYPGRGEAVILAPFVAVLASGAQRGGRVVVALLVALGLGGSGAVVASWWQSPPRPEERVARTLLQRHSSGVVVTTGWWWLGVRYHLPASWRVVHLPREALRHPGWFVPGRERVSDEELLQAREALAEAARRGEGTAVIVVPGLAEAEELRAWCQRWGWRRGSFPGGELWTP